MRTPSDLYAAADEALYRAKALGRDRTELHVAAA
jgi:PleD family two-component response regulator